MEKWYATTRWSTEDVIGIAKENGVDMTEEQAERWWAENEKSFEERLVEFGNEVLSYMI